MNDFKPFEMNDAYEHLHDVLIKRSDLMKHRNKVDVPFFFVIGFVNFGEGFLLSIVDDEVDTPDDLPHVDRNDFENEYYIVGQIDLESRIKPASSFH